MNVSQLFMIGIPADGDLSAVRELQPGGIILMGRNAGTPTEVRRLTRAIKENLEIAPLMGTDHEGGRVQRLRDGFTQVPPAREVGAQGAQAVGLSAMNVAAELRGCGINTNFAPVCDVPVHEGDTVIGNRAYSTDPIKAGVLAGEYIRGAQPTILCCAKHFPGHGGVGVDSHHGLPMFGGSREELEFHLGPFRAAMAAGVGSVMISHVAIPIIDPTGSPASLSAPIITGLLRENLGFRGLVFTDDMEMKALDQDEEEQNTIRAIAAGCDMVMFCHTSEKAIKAKKAVERAVQEGALSAERVQDAINRVMWAKKRFGVIKSDD